MTDRDQKEIEQDDMGDSLSSIHTQKGCEEILDELERAAKRGKLPGYVPRPAQQQFVVRDFGFPFESELVASITQVKDSDELQVVCVRKLRRLMPTVFGVLLVVSAWPGVWLADSMMETYFPGTLAAQTTYWWYLILTVPFLPWAWNKTMRQSRQSGLAEATRIVSQIKDLLHPQE